MAFIDIHTSEWQKLVLVGLWGCATRIISIYCSHSSFPVGGQKLTMLALNPYPGDIIKMSAKKWDQIQWSYICKLLELSCMCYLRDLYVDFRWRTNWLLELDYLAKINKKWLHKDFKGLNLTHNVKLAQQGEHYTGSLEVPRSNLMEVYLLFCWKFFAISMQAFNANIANFV